MAVPGPVVVAVYVPISAVQPQAAGEVEFTVNKQAGAFENATVTVNAEPFELFPGILKL